MNNSNFANRSVASIVNENFAAARVFKYSALTSVVVAVLRSLMRVVSLAPMSRVYARRSLKTMRLSVVLYHSRRGLQTC